MPKSKEKIPVRRPAIEPIPTSKSNVPYIIAGIGTAAVVGAGGALLAPKFFGPESHSVPLVRPVDNPPEPTAQLLPTATIYIEPPTQEPPPSPTEAPTPASAVNPSESPRSIPNRQDIYNAAGGEIQNADPTFTLAELTQWQCLLVYGVLGVTGLALLSGNRRLANDRRKKEAEAERKKQEGSHH